MSESVASTPEKTDMYAIASQHVTERNFSIP
jgi:hypothetical protein